MKLRSMRGDRVFDFNIPKQLDGIFKKIRVKAKVNCTLHDLRRTCCTRMLESGVPAHIVQELMGAR